MREQFSVSVDWRLVAPVVVLISLSLATLSAMSMTLLKSQLISLGVSVIVFFVFSQTNYRAMQWYGTHFYIASLIVLSLVLFIGLQSRGAVRWLTLFGVSIQFSEIIKPFLALSLASFLASKKPSFATLVRVVLLALPITLLIFLQPDLGNVLVYVASITIVMLVFGFSFFWFLGSLFATLLFSPFLWRLLHEYQRQRLLAFLSPAQDPLGTSYNTMQSMIAVGSGMVFGKGLFESTQSGLRFLPERHSDFIFASLSEGFGFIGALVVCLCFGFLLYRIYTFFFIANDTFTKIFTATSFALLLVQFFFNVGMNIGIVPVVGITLPFMSYGGSSLVANAMLLGLVSSVSRIAKNRAVLEIG